MSGEIKTLLILPHIKVHNANALSSPFTIGFPAMTAWLGATHALQRKLNHDGFTDLSFIATGVVSHQCALQTHKGVGDYVSSIIGTGNPLDKNGSRSAFIEEARCHLDVTLLVELNGLTKSDEVAVLARVTHHLQGHMKMASGDIKGFHEPYIQRVEDGEASDIAMLTRKLMPGYVLVERRDLMIAAMDDGQDAMDALLDYLVIHQSCTKDDEGNVTWQAKRKTYQDKPAGWIVPIATGFHGITELGEAKNQRDPETPHRFAESMVTLGEFKMPYRIHSLNEIMWHYAVVPESNLYLCQQTHTQQKLASTDDWSDFY
ncbi:type I-F CRISPR-associated protein Csy2 [Shewanella electrodiphila]|uniref:Type I-F CRISPR-associated protein Csy2 n=1 Tax=Shewanella electrodiphila TaxID=934143 RepID=A0ABT0KUR2_9GAMM|nr:type I-F CRISPR-associated protein Csy2 [Shewanella electrodiphila]MCL1047539.1 type I-F CRISPR-associated protein Csy2 [Shewanella electrodiphila]